MVKSLHVSYVVPCTLSNQRIRVQKRRPKKGKSSKKRDKKDGNCDFFFNFQGVIEKYFYQRNNEIVKKWGQISEELGFEDINLF